MAPEMHDRIRSNADHLQKASTRARVRRLVDRPIISPDLSPGIGSNINGPSLIRVPDWVPDPLGRYYLYFASHYGDHIRLAHADELAGPWRIFEPGVLHVTESHFIDHIASPDVFVDEERREIRLYYHGVVDAFSNQKTRVALSRDGLRFEADPAILMDWYARVFRWDGMVHAMTMPGTMWRSGDGLSPFERGPSLFTPQMRHSAVRVRGDELDIYYTNRGDCPESIIATTLDLRPDWMSWSVEPGAVILSPERPYEGSELPLAASEMGGVRHPVRQLRDPAVFEEDGRTYLLYAAAGEAGICIAELL